MQPLDDKRPDYLALGRISGLFGVRGWVKVFSDTQPRENITQYAAWWLKGTGGSWKEHKVVQARPHGKTIIASLEGITTREAAATLIGQQVAVPRNLLPAAQEGEYYWADLIGCDVVLGSGESLGKVDRLFETGANDVLVVKGGLDADKKEILIPWIVPDVITRIDLTTQLITVDWDPDF